MARHAPSTDSNSFALVAVTAVLLGLLVGVLGIVSVLMWADARNNRSTANDTAATLSTPAMSMGALTSYAGAAPEDAMAQSMAHKAFPASLPPPPPVRSPTYTSCSRTSRSTSHPASSTPPGRGPVVRLAR